MVLYTAIMIIAMMIILSIKVVSKKAVMTVVIDNPSKVPSFELTLNGSKEAINSIVFVDVESILEEAEGLYETIEEQLEMHDRKRAERNGMGHCAHCRREHRARNCGGRGAQKYKAKK